MNKVSVHKEWRRREISEIVNSVRLLQGVGQRQSRDFVRKHRITGQQLGALRIVALSQTKLIRLRAFYDYTVSLNALDRATGKRVW